MRILVVGAGMYVTGRGTTGSGTVLPAIAESSRVLPIDGVTVCATKKSNGRLVHTTMAKINDRLGTSVPVSYALSSSVLAAARLREFDCAIVSVPDDRHYAVVEQLLRRKLHCLVVKPFTPTLGEARALVALQERAGVHGVVELHKRYDESNLVIKRLLYEGKIGRISSIAVDYSQRVTIPAEIFRAWAARTNIFQYLGVHYVDLIYFLTGWLPRRALAIGSRGVLTRRGIDTYDSVHALVVWENPDHAQEQFVSQFNIGWVDPPLTTALSDQGYTIVGERGRIECDQKHRGLTVIGEDRVDCVNPYFSEYLMAEPGVPRFSGYGFQSIHRFLKDVADIVDGRAEAAGFSGTRPTFREATVSTAVVEAVNDSLAKNSTWRKVQCSI